MQTRSFSDRVRHALSFEIVGLAIFTPLATLAFDKPAMDMGVIGLISATVATLWNLTQALQVDFAGLLEGRVEPEIRVVPAAAAPVIEGRGRDVVIRILSAPQSVGDHEIYEIHFKPNAVLDSAPHRAGCREDLVVLEGAVTVKSGSETAELRVNDAANYAADCPHSVTAGEDAARVMMIVRNS